MSPTAATYINIILTIALAGFSAYQGAGGGNGGAAIGAGIAAAVAALNSVLHANSPPIAGPLAK